MDDSTADDLTHSPERLTRFWLMLAGSMLFFGLQAGIAWSILISTQEIVKTNAAQIQMNSIHLESLSTQTSTYQEADTNRINRLEQRIDAL